MTLFHQLTPTEATHVTTLDLINQDECQAVTTRTLQRTGHRRMQPGTGRVKAGLLTGRQAGGRHVVPQLCAWRDSDQRTQRSDVTQVHPDTTRELKMVPPLSKAGRHGVSALESTNSKFPIPHPSYFLSPHPQFPIFLESP